MKYIRNLKKWLLAIIAVMIIYQIRHTRFFWPQIVSKNSTKFVIKLVNQNEKYISLTTTLMKNTLNSPVSQVSEHFPNTDYLRYKTNDLDCQKIFSGDVKETFRSVTFDKKYKPIPLESYLNWSNNCENFRRDRYYDDYKISKNEEGFPIAYSIVFHKNLEQVERLLRSIYRRHNVYCLHIDKKAPKELQLATKALMKCFSNVFIASKLESVVYASISRLQADINCMHDLLNTDTKWKYLINLSGQCFPIKTNSEIVKILKIYNGSNDIEGLTGKKALLHRAKFKYKIMKQNNSPGEFALVKTREQQSDPPNNIHLVKGSAFGIFSRPYVEYVCTSNVSKAFLAWLADVYSPDEYFWSTLHHASYNPHLNVPGSYKGPPDDKAWLASYSLWQGVDVCHGIWVHGVCVFSTKDLPNIFSKKSLFVNKFYLHVNPTAIECLEEKLYNRTMKECTFNDTFYRNLRFVKSLGQRFQPVTPNNSMGSTSKVMKSAGP